MALSSHCRLPRERSPAQASSWSWSRFVPRGDAPGASQSAGRIPRHAVASDASADAPQRRASDRCSGVRRGRVDGGGRPQRLVAGHDGARRRSRPGSPVVAGSTSCSCRARCWCWRSRCRAPRRSSAAKTRRLRRAWSIRCRLARMSARPWLGWGPGSTPWTISQHLRPRPGVNPPVGSGRGLHSLPMQILYELGGLGFLFTLGTAAIFLRRRIGERDRAEDPRIFSPGSIGMLGAATTRMGGAALSVTAVPLAAAVAAGIALAARPRRDEPAPLLAGARLRSGGDGGAGAARPRARLLRASRSPASAAATPAGRERTSRARPGGILPSRSTLPAPPGSPVSTKPRAGPRSSPTPRRRYGSKPGAAAASAGAEWAAASLGEPAR